MPITCSVLFHESFLSHMRRFASLSLSHPSNSVMQSYLGIIKRSSFGLCYKLFLARVTFYVTLRCQKTCAKYIKTYLAQFAVSPCMHAYNVENVRHIDGPILCRRKTSAKCETCENKHRSPGAQHEPVTNCSDRMTKSAWSTSRASDGVTVTYGPK